MGKRPEKISCIYAVHYDEDTRHISQVKARINPASGTLEPLRVYTKSEILNQIDTGFYVVTMVKGGVDHVVGAEVMAYTINGKRYLKTVANDTEEDNLGELPTF